MAPTTTESPQMVIINSAVIKFAQCSFLLSVHA